VDTGHDLLHETFTSDSIPELEVLVGNFLFVQLTFVNTDGLGVGVQSVVGGFPIKLDGEMVYGSVLKCGSLVGYLYHYCSCLQ
jgi:hypothetical protein